jgi:hypothetical protein
LIRSSADVRADPLAEIYRHMLAPPVGSPRFWSPARIPSIVLVLVLVLAGVVGLWALRPAPSGSTSPGPGGLCGSNSPGNLGDPDATDQVPTLVFASSAAGYAFSQFAVQRFSQNITCVVASLNEGPGAKVLSALCSGEIDIGAYAGTVSSATLQADGCTAPVTWIPFAADGVVPMTGATNPTVAYLRSLRSNSSFLVPGIKDVLVANGTVQWTDNRTGAENSEPLFSFNRSTLTAIYAVTSTRVGGNNLSAALDGYSIRLNASYLGNVTSNCARTVTQCLLWSQVPFPAGCGTVQGGMPQPGGVRDREVVGSIDALDQTGVSSSEAGFLDFDLGPPPCGYSENLSECGIHALQVQGPAAMLSATSTDPNSLGFDDMLAVIDDGADVISAGFLGLNQTHAVPATMAAVSAGQALGPTGNNSTNEVYGSWFTLEYLTTPLPAGFTLDFLDLVENSTTDIELCDESGLIPPLN